MPGTSRAGASPSALVVLSLIPVVAGSLRLLEIAGGPQLMPTNPRIDASPAPLVVHVLGAALYALLGAFQFSARLRRRHLNWHRTVRPDPGRGRPGRRRAPGSG